MAPVRTEPPRAPAPTAFTLGLSRALGLAGVLGGILYLSGDFLFYGELGPGAFSPIAVMQQRGDATLVAGGVVAPLASAGYILGTLGIALTIRARSPRLAASFFAGWAGMFLFGIAYHAVYTTRAFAAKLADPASAELMLSRIGALLSSLYTFEAAMGAAGTLALGVAVLRGASGYPRWLLLLLPTVWALADAIPRALPAPLGSVLAGGWINGWFTIFFAVSWLARKRDLRTSPDGSDER